MVSLHTIRLSVTYIKELKILSETRKTDQSMAMDIGSTTAETASGIAIIAIKGMNAGKE
jgi:hypothetical protein